MIDTFTLYEKLPYPFKVLGASLKGYQLKRQRYCAATEEMVNQALAREHWSDSRLKDWQENQLSRLLHNAANNVPFYRQHWFQRRLKGDRSSYEDLSNWDVLTKETIRKNPEAFIAENWNRKLLIEEHTSGTTGSPLKMWFSRATLQSWYALVETRWRRWYGVSFHDRWAILGGKPVTPFDRQKPPFWVWNQGLNQLYLSVNHLKPDWISYYADAIIKHKIIYLYGYSSALYQFAYELLKQGIKLDMKVIITNAEPLYDFQRQLLSQCFGCPVIETFGQSEKVSAASECEYGHLHIWPEVGYIEAIDEFEKEVKDGNPGRLITTGLLNDAMPLIRYDTLDMVALSSEKSCQCGRTLAMFKNIFGRKDDVIILKDDRKVFLLDIIFYPILRIKEAQIIQQELDEFLIKVVPAEDWGETDVENLKNEMVNKLGNVNITVEPVEQLEKTWRGKARFIISKVSNPDQPDNLNISEDR